MVSAKVFDLLALGIHNSILGLLYTIASVTIMYKVRHLVQEFYLHSVLFILARFASRIVCRSG